MIKHYLIRERDDARRKMKRYEEAWIKNTHAPSADNNMRLMDYWDIRGQILTDLISEARRD